MKRFFCFYSVTLFLISQIEILGQQPTIVGIEIVQLNVQNIGTPHNNSDAGILEVEFTPADAAFFNVTAQYSGTPVTPDWTIRNLYLPPSSDYSSQHKIAMRFDLQPFGITDGTNMSGNLSITYYVYSSPAASQGALTGGTSQNISVGDLNETARNENSEESSGSGTTTVPSICDNTDNVSFKVYRGCEVPNLQLDHGTYGTTGSYGGDRNACAPAAVTNCLQWLREKYGITAIEPNARTLISTISNNMARTSADGVTINNWIKGILEYIKDNSLNLQVKFQSETENSDITHSDHYADNQNSASYPTWDWLKQEMSDGEDVEISIRYYDPGSESYKEHALVMAGLLEKGSPVTGRTIQAKHDFNQETNESGDTKEENFDVTIDGNGRMVVRFEDGRSAYIKNVISVSPGTPFPVELINFNSHVKDQIVILNWETATELDNYGFSIERHFENENWTAIGFVNGNGNSNSPKYYSFTDYSISVAGRYFYRLKQIDNNGAFEYSFEIEVTLAAPTHFDLMQNHPNPFNPVTTIQFDIPYRTKVSIKLYDVLGDEVAIIVNNEIQAGRHSTQFDGSNLPSGIYFYMLTTDNFSQTKSLMILK